MNMCSRLLTFLCCMACAGCPDCSWVKEGQKIRSGVFVSENYYVPLYTEPPASTYAPITVSDTADWPEPISTVLIVDREAGTVVMRHTEPDGRVVERFFRIGTQEDPAAQYEVEP